MKGFEEKSKQQAQDTELSVKREFARLETSISAELQSSSQSISNAIREQNGRLTGMIRTSVSAAMAWIFSFCPADRYPGRDNLVSGHDHHLAPERDGQLQPTAGEPESGRGAGVTIYSDDKNRTLTWWCCRSRRTAWKPTHRRPTTPW
ncbi:MbeB family mobilization protein (plasmid) [Serratia ureilytica]